MTQIEIARAKVLRWMYKQQAKGVYPYAWNAPAWGEYQAALYSSTP